MDSEILKIGTDFDGVLCYALKKYPSEKNFFQMNGEERKKKWAFDEEEMRIAKPFLLDKLLEKYRNFVIITARQEYDRKITEEWLKKYNVEFLKVYYNNLPLTRETITRFKASTINQLNLSLFLEDDGIMARKLVKLCPNCVIVQIYGTTKGN